MISFRYSFKELEKEMGTVTQIQIHWSPIDGSYTLVQGHTNGELGIESRSRIRVGPMWTGVRSSELVLHEVVTLWLLGTFTGSWSMLGSISCAICCRNDRLLRSGCVEEDDTSAASLSVPVEFLLLPEDPPSSSSEG